MLSGIPALCHTLTVTQFRPELTAGHWKMTDIKLALSNRSSSFI